MKNIMDKRKCMILLKQKGSFNRESLAGIMSQITNKTKTSQNIQHDQTRAITF
jgi:hypothetical protein